jgi:uncharacterized protein DUF6632
VYIFFALRDLAGGHRVARTSAESPVGVGGIALYGWDLSSGVDFMEPGSVGIHRCDDAESLYVTLGILLLIAVRNPSAHRSLIAFAAWSSFAHAALMTVMAFRDASERGHLVGVAILVVIGLPLLMLVPAKQSGRAES